jgi:hypothetical protein
MEYRLRGGSYDQIATKVGISKTRVHKIIREELDRATAATALTAEQYRQLHLDQLNKMEFPLMTAALGGDQWAVDRVIRIQQQRERLIPGLAIPSKVTVGAGGIGEDGNPSSSAPIVIHVTPAEAKL